MSNTSIIIRNDRGGYSIQAPNSQRAIGNYQSIDSAIRMCDLNGWESELPGSKKTTQRIDAFLNWADGEIPRGGDIERGYNRVRAEFKGGAE